MPASTAEDVEYITQFHSFLEHRAERDKQVDPLAKYFGHSPSAHQFSVGHCPEPGQQNFPQYASGTRILHYASEAQHILFHDAGSLYNYRLQAQYIENLPSHEFSAYMLPLKHVDHGRRFLCLVDPGGREAWLPKTERRARSPSPELGLPSPGGYRGRRYLPSAIIFPSTWWTSRRSPTPFRRRCLRGP